ncbi:caspase family protein [Leptolyngbya cf. ectocarpi LEGE 11479]|uniref:Caspase family protein n=1 Tax=Leptolyngbya cf. ectocarpi LEGE 11479 TaxID=1828722 RepID=A0A928ZVH8_LEPEC|nr:caspase family protein [Leptolyngbya ectocarpi]MBE9068193.1 caspase family protein [Leptolyngbya cf. ectocarpi LEGE 11479]
MGAGKNKTAGKVAATPLSPNAPIEPLQDDIDSGHRPQSRVNKFALLIGVSEYDCGFPELPGALKDAQAMKTVLSSSLLGNFDQVLPLLENPDSSRMQQAIHQLFANRNEDDLVLLYFSGHGFKDISNRLYLGAKNSSRDSHGGIVNSSVVSANFIHDLMNRCQSKHQVIILDCCFSGAFPEGFVSKDDTSIDIHSQLGGKGRVILSSSGATQLSFSGITSDLSPYTQYLIEGICEGKGSINELHQYVKQRIQAKFPELRPEMYTEQEGRNIQIFPNIRFSSNTKSLMNTLICSEDIDNKTILSKVLKTRRVPIFTFIIICVLLYVIPQRTCQVLRNRWYAGGEENAWLRTRYIYNQSAPEKMFCESIGVPIDYSN